MTEDSKALKQSLRSLGVSGQAIDAVWPTWWSDDAEGSKSAQVELRFTVARRLGLSPRSLFDKETPTFVWRHEAKFKGLSAFNDTEKAALTSFGIAFARILIRATPEPAGHSLVGLSAAELRGRVMRRAPFVSLSDLVAVCWGLGIPVVHLRVFPLSAKRMHAMAVRVDDRFAILIGKDASYPAPTAYHLAHEMGHVANGHLADAGAIIDLDEPIEMTDRDTEEIEADAFALEFLTGRTRPTIEMNAAAKNGAEHCKCRGAEWTGQRDRAWHVGTMLRPSNRRLADRICCPQPDLSRQAGSLAILEQNSFSATRHRCSFRG